MKETPYLLNLSREASKRHDITQISQSIADHGFWESRDEWRIFTTTEKRIEPVERNGKRWFKVRVACDYEFICHSPTLERAVEFLGVYECLIMDLFYSLGWASTAAPAELTP